MAISLQLNPIAYYNTPENIGGFSSVRAKYSSEIVQQFDSSSITNEFGICHLLNDKFLFEFSTKNSSINYSFQKLLSEFAISEKLSFSIIIENILTRDDFFKFWSKKVQGCRFCLEFIDMNGFSFVINPLNINYTYQGSGVYSDGNRYELTFSRAKQIDYPINAYKIIQKITSINVNYTGVAASEATIILHNEITQSLFDFGYSTQNDVDTIIYQNVPASNIIHQLTDGVYYFFAVNRNCPTLFDYLKATIVAGAVVIIHSESENPQIITENETSIDEGIIMPE